MVRQQILTGDPLAMPAVLGFAPSTRTWVTEADHADSQAYAAVPPLDGELVVDPESRRDAATDLGRIVRREPSAVLRPACGDDIAAIVRFCDRQGIGVSIRGQAHTTFGQGLSDGILIDGRYLDRIHRIGADAVEVDAGVTWKQLVTATVRDGLTPPVLTGYTNLSVGGTLSVGGIGGLVGGLHTGLQVDHVQELEVVTGEGETVRCSRTQNHDLFVSVLGGLGRFGVITRAVLDLVPAPPRARTYSFEYDNTEEFFRDLHAMIARPGIDHVYGELFRTDEGRVLLIHATAFYDPSEGPDDDSLTHGIACSTPTVVDRSYLAHAFSIDDAIDELIDDVNWNRLIKPWFDVWLPGTSVRSCVEEIVSSLEPADIGPYGAALIYPQRRSLTGMPTPRMPAGDGSEWAFVFDLNTVAGAADSEQEFTERMLERNRRLFLRARDEHGACLYPIGSVPLTDVDWRDHFGDLWDTVLAHRRRFDPNGTLTAGESLPV